LQNPHPSQVVGASQHFYVRSCSDHSTFTQLPGSLHFREPTSHATSTDPLDRLLALNRLYAQHTTAKDPNAFVDLAKGQAPEILWLGCSDSRLSESTICQCQPGDIFVHRNIANTVHANDINSASVVEYAVAHLKVKKVVVCGHTKCGGATAALGDADLGQTLNTWLHPVRE
jgi:carbonic anhydrase